MKLQRTAIHSGIALVIAAAMSGQSVYAQSMTVALYGGIAQKAITTCVLDPFSQKTGVTITPDIGSSAVTLTKLVTQRNKPSIDVAWVDGGVSEQAWSQGVLEEQDPSRIPNLENLIHQAKYVADNKIYAASNGYYSLGILYNTDLVKTAPTSWQDMWKEEYAGMVALPLAQVSMGLPLFVHIAELNGGSIEDTQPAVDAFRKLDVAAFYNSAGTVSNMFQSQEISVAPHFSSSAFALIKAGGPYKFVNPSDKGIANDMRIHLVRNGPNRELGEQLVNFSLTEEAALCFVREFNMGPYIKGVKVPSEYAAYMPWGESGSIDDLALPNWPELLNRRDQLIEKFENEVVTR
ncbi:ABC transporter substrate-binding protein [Pollutimonas thiosulfatoxidans]|uniref:ABC transporter substrate-binding protein n=1 Tax=Pollutimonas thiosulfatoxidans TaxID=2028345 RepID=A0A410GFI6_9BURK|nr:ABC transporter substrate-binding protein [Pollutimonas thiosulfatoxidans]QAA95067.1 hypothetical protein CKA81_15260 [Pollutimonas thiosulfatoxidans]